MLNTSSAQFSGSFYRLKRNESVQPQKEMWRHARTATGQARKKEIPHEKISCAGGLSAALFVRPLYLHSWQRSARRVRCDHWGRRKSLRWRAGQGRRRDSPAWWRPGSGQIAVWNIHELHSAGIPNPSVADFRGLKHAHGNRQAIALQSRPFWAFFSPHRFSMLDIYIQFAKVLISTTRTRQPRSRKGRPRW